MLNMKKVIFIVQGYTSKLEDGRLENVTAYEIYAKSRKEAVTKAKKYLKKAFYRISQVIEK